jgi:hypothetical protein
VQAFVRPAAGSEGLNAWRGCDFDVPADTPAALARAAVAVLVELRGSLNRLKLQRAGVARLRW